MSKLQFEWDATKAAKNRRRHRVTFDEATTVWNDEHRIEDLDAVHSSEAEVRLQILGLSDRLRLLLVIFTERDEAIRLISARRATRAEEQRYWARF